MTSFTLKDAIFRSIALIRKDGEGYSIKSYKIQLCKQIRIIYLTPETSRFYVLSGRFNILNCLKS